ncbi:MAG: GTPase family protein, partial [Planctomycetota bacterium]
MTGPAAPDHRLEIQGLIDALSELIVEPWPIRSFQGGAKKLEARLAEIEAKAQATEKTLVVLLLGGTGVGKSTFLNALAGQPIAGTSDAIRAYTSQLNLFHHEDASIGFLTQGIEDRFEHHAHTAEPLRDKVVIDAPDVDSTEVKHQELVEAFLPKVDVVLYLTSWQKYRNSAVGDVIAGLRGSHSFVFIMNQVDRVRSEGERQELLDHFAEQLRGYGFEAPFVLGISAKRAESGDKDGAFDFQRLEELLVRNLRTAEIRLIKESGLLGRLRTLMQKMRKLTGSTGRDGLATLAERLEATENALQRDRVALQQTLLTEVEGLIERARARFERRFSRTRDASVSGPYGLFLRGHAYLAGESRRPGPAGLTAAEHGRHDLKVQSALIRTLEGARAAVRGHDIGDGVLGEADAEGLARS